MAPCKKYMPSKIELCAMQTRRLLETEQALTSGEGRAAQPRRCSWTEPEIIPKLPPAHLGGNFPLHLLAYQRREIRDPSLALPPLTGWRIKKVTRAERGSVRGNTRDTADAGAVLPPPPPQTPRMMSRGFFALPPAEMPGTRTQFKTWLAATQANSWQRA